MISLGPKMSPFSRTHANQEAFSVELPAAADLLKALQKADKNRHLKTVLGLAVCIVVQMGGLATQILPLSQDIRFGAGIVAVAFAIIVSQAYVGFWRISRDRDMLRILLETLEAEEGLKTAATGQGSGGPRAVTFEFSTQSTTYGSMVQKSWRDPLTSYINGAAHLLDLSGSISPKRRRPLNAPTPEQKIEFRWQHLETQLTLNFQQLMSDPRIGTMANETTSR